MAANCTLSALASTNRLISFQNISRTQTMNGALSMKNERFGTLFKIFWPATPPAAAQNGNFPPQNFETNRRPFVKNSKINFHKLQIFFK